MAEMLELPGFDIPWLLLLISICVSVFLWFSNREMKIKFEKRVSEEIEYREGEIRTDAISRSARTLSGKTLEKLVPFVKEFGHDPHDVRWLGDPVDLVVFDGYSASGRKKVDGVTFVEVKSGDSSTSPGQNSIRDAIRGRKVRWEEFRVA